MRMSKELENPFISLLHPLERKHTKLTFSIGSSFHGIQCRKTIKFCKKFLFRYTHQSIPCTSLSKVITFLQEARCLAPKVSRDIIIEWHGKQLIWESGYTLGKQMQEDYFKLGRYRFKNEYKCRNQIARAAHVNHSGCSGSVSGLHFILFGSLIPDEIFVLFQKCVWS